MNAGSFVFIRNVIPWVCMMEFVAAWFSVTGVLIKKINLKT